MEILEASSISFGPSPSVLGCFDACSRPDDLYTLLADQISNVQVEPFNINTARIPIFTDPTTDIKADIAIGDMSLQTKSIRLMTAFSSASPNFGGGSSGFESDAGAAIAGT